MVIPIKYSDGFVQNQYFEGYHSLKGLRLAPCLNSAPNVVEIVAVAGRRGRVSAACERLCMCAT